MEIWVLNKTSSIKLNLDHIEKIGQLFSKQEGDVSYFDFLHVNREFKMSPLNFKNDASLKNSWNS
jgi:hypothetical protein